MNTVYVGNFPVRSELVQDLESRGWIVLPKDPSFVHIKAADAVVVLNDDRIVIGIATAFEKPVFVTGNPLEGEDLPNVVECGRLPDNLFLLLDQYRMGKNALNRVGPDGTTGEILATSKSVGIVLPTGQLLDGRGPRFHGKPPVVAFLFVGVFSQLIDGILPPEAIEAIRSLEVMSVTGDSWDAIMQTLVRHLDRTVGDQIRGFIDASSPARDAEPV